MCTYIKSINSEVTYYTINMRTCWDFIKSVVHHEANWLFEEANI